MTAPSDTPPATSDVSPHPTPDAGSAVLALPVCAEIGATHWEDFAVTPDGSLLAVLHFGGRIDLRRGSDGGLVRTLLAGPRRAEALWLAGGGRLLATREWETLRIWSTADGQLLRETNARPVDALSPGGDAYLVGAERRVRRLSDGATLWEDPRLTRAGSFSSNGRFLATGDATDNVVWIWDAATGAEVAVLRFPRDWRRASSVAVADDGAWAAALAGERRVAVWRLRDGRRFEIVDHAEGGLELAPDGRYLGIRGGDRRYPGWIDLLPLGDDGPGERQRLGEFLAGDLVAGGRLMMLERGSALSLRSVADGRPIWRAEPGAGHSESVTDVAVSRTGRRAASADYGGRIVVWDVDERRALRVLQADREQRAVALSPDGAWVASAGQQVNGGPRDLPKVRVWQIESARQIAEIQLQVDGRTVAAEDLAFDGAGARLYVTTRGERAPDVAPDAGHYEILAHRTDDWRRAFRIAGLSGRPGLSDDGRLLATATATHIRIHRAIDGAVLREAPMECGQTMDDRPCSDVHLGFSPDGKHLVASYFGPLRVHDVETLAISLRVPPFQIHNHHFAISSDSRLLAVSPSQDERSLVTVHSLTDGRALYRIGRDAPAPHGFTFAPGRSALLTSDADHLLRLRCY